MQDEASQNWDLYKVLFRLGKKEVKNLPEFSAGQESDEIIYDGATFETLGNEKINTDKSLVQEGFGNGPAIYIFRGDMSISTYKQDQLHRLVICIKNDQ